MRILASILLMAIGGAACGVDERSVPCGRDCGEGFFCDFSRDRCASKPGIDPVVSLEELKDGAVLGTNALGELPLRVACRVDAPQIESVTVQVESPEGDVSRIRARKSDAPGVFLAEYTELMGAGLDGVHEFVCNVAFGPPGATVEARTETVRVVFDRRSPVVTILDSELWGGRHGVTRVRASIVDERSGLVAEQTRLKVENRFIKPVRQDDVFEFSISGLSFADDSDARFELFAEDAAGNETAATGVIRLDASAPVVTVIKDDSWHAYDGGAIAVLARVSDEGAGELQGPPVLAFQHDPELVVQGDLQEGDAWRFVLDPATFAKPGEAAAYDWSIRVVDVTGNPNSVPGSTRVDGTAPEVELRVEPGWAARNEWILVQVTASDSGAGVGDAPKVVGAAGSDATCSPVEDGWTCQISAMHVAEKTTEPEWPIEVEVSDRAGNATVARTFASVDGKAPALAIDAPTHWMRRQQTARVVITADDADGAGVESIALRIAGGPRSGAVVDGRPISKQEAEFVIELSEYTDPNTEGRLLLRASAEDAVGNVGIADFELLYDGVPPDIAVDAVESWLRFAAATRVSLTATVSSNGSGSPVDRESVYLRRLRDGKELRGTPSGAHSWAYELPMAEWGAAGEEVEARWEVVARDESGNEARRQGVLRVDGKPPLLRLSYPAGWVRRGDTIPVAVDYEDAGAGVAPDSLVVSISGGQTLPCSALTTPGKWSCGVPTTAAAAGANTPAYSFQVHGEDRVGNTIEDSGALRVDGKPPTVSIAPDAAWYALDSTVVVVANVMDDASGLAELPTLEPDFPAGTVEQLVLEGQGGAGGKYTFAFEPRRIAKPNLTHDAFQLRVRAVDSVGNESSVVLTRQFDDQPPTLVGLPADSALVFMRDGEVELSIKVSDRGVNALGKQVEGAGVDPEDVELVYWPLDRSVVTVPGTESAGSIIWRLPAHEFAIVMYAPGTLRGVSEVRWHAADRVGHRVQESRDVLIDRVTASTPPADYAGNVLGAPAIQGNRAYFSTDTTTVSANNLVAANISGGIAWTHRLMGPARTPVSIGSSGTLYVVQQNRLTGRAELVGFSTSGASPQLSWSCDGLGEVDGSLAVTQWYWNGQQSEVVVAASDSAFIAMRKNGAGCDRLPLLLGADLSMSEVSTVGGAVFGVSNDGRVFTASLVNSAPLGYPLTGWSQSKQYALSGTAPNGVLLDSSLFGPLKVMAVSSTRLVTLDGALSVLTSLNSTGLLPSSGHLPLLLGEGRLVSTSSGNRLVMVNVTNGSRYSGFPMFMNAGGIVMAPVATNDGLIHYLTKDGHLQAVTMNGELAWNAQVCPATDESDLRGSLAVAPDGKLVVPCVGGGIKIVQTDSTGLADAPWPKAQRDYRNSGTAPSFIIGP